MREEAKELYFYTKGQFEEELNKITPFAASVIIAVRQVVKNAMFRYIEEYCSNGDNPFSEEDFQEVSWIIHNEITEA